MKVIKLSFLNENNLEVSTTNLYDVIYLLYMMLFMRVIVLV